MWVLIIVFFAGAASNGDNVSISTADFLSQETCEAAGNLSRSKFETMHKDVKFICAKK